jgi:hypothetical protein
MFVLPRPHYQPDHPILRVQSLPASPRSENHEIPNRTDSSPTNGDSCYHVPPAIQPPARFNALFRVETREKAWRHWVGGERHAGLV